MGGKSSSSSASTSNTTQSDERIAATDNAYVRTFRLDGSNNTLTDYDAIQSAGSAVLAALDSSNEIAKLALGQSTQSLDTLRGGQETLLSYKADADLEKDERLTTKLAPYLLAGASVFALTKVMK